ncbi:CU044_5270 family protein [Plantactinospora sp. WMMB334]|uniref:CU044_5270 family protein n=1 Tax=Plantactinospora sp. WMMB334 TaxID=3404119 RepID=UPI003B937B2C
MDEFDMLSGARQVDPPSPETTAAARGALLRLIREESAAPAATAAPDARHETARPARARRGSRPPVAAGSRWRRRPRARVMVPAVAGALALAVVLVVSSQEFGPPATSGGGQATSTEPGSPGSPGSPGIPGAGQAAGSARRLLLAAAEKTLAEPASGEGTYWMSTVEQGTLLHVGRPGDEYAIMGRRIETTWHSLTPATSTTFTTRWAGAAPASDADRAAWRRAGSPTRWPIDAPPNCPPDPSKRYTAEAASTGETTRADPGEARFVVAGEYLTPAQIRALPSEPGELKAWLTDTIVRQNLPHGTDVETGESIFDSVVNLLFGAPITPAVRAGAYRVLADLAGVRTLGAVTDARGRAGVAVTVERNDTPEEQAANSGGPTQVSIVFDPQQGRTLALETRVLHPADYLAWVPAGALFDYRLLVESDWVDEAPEGGRSVSGAEMTPVC